MKKNDYRIDCYNNNEKTFTQEYVNFFDAAEFLKAFKELCEVNENVIDIQTEGVFIDTRYYLNTVIAVSKDNNIIKFEIVGV